MALSAMGLKLGVFGFSPTTHAKTNVIQMCPRSLHAVQHFTRVYLHAETAVDASDIRTWRTTVILITGKPKDPQFEPHAGIKIAQVLESPVYIYGTHITDVFQISFKFCQFISFLTETSVHIGQAASHPVRLYSVSTNMCPLCPHLWISQLHPIHKMQYEYSTSNQIYLAWQIQFSFIDIIKHIDHSQIQTYITKYLFIYLGLFIYSFTV